MSERPPSAGGDDARGAVGADDDRHLTMVEAIRETLRAEMERDEDVVVYGEDVGVDGGVFRATQGLIEEYPDQVYDFPLSEAGIIGTGVGLAAYGLRPVPEIQFVGFLAQAFHQLTQHVARLRSRSRGRFACPMTVRAPHGGGIRALEHHCESPEAIYGHVAGLQVVVPSSPAEAAGLLASAVRSPDPVVFLEPTRLYRSVREPVPEDRTIPIGEARVVQEGEDVTLVTWGGTMQEARRAVEAVDASVELLDPRSIYPFDTDALVASVEKTGRCVVAHEAQRSGGFGAEVVARINDEALYSLEAPVQRVTGPDVPYPMPGREEAFLPNANRIARGIERALDA